MNWEAQAESRANELTQDGKEMIANGMETRAVIFYLREQTALGEKYWTQIVTELEKK